MTADLATRNFLQYIHLEKLYGHLPGLSEALPAIFGLSAGDYAAARRGFDEQAARAAETLLAQPGIRRSLDALPFRSGDTVLAVGDSITDDLASWAEILRHLLRQARPQDQITVVNAGLSAHTTGMVLRRWPATLVGSSPTWIICALGGNDVTRVGPDATKSQVSLSESMANLRELRRIAGTLTSASWVWMTPVPVRPERVKAFPGFQYGMSSWDNADIAALADAMGREFVEPVVDLVTTFGMPAQDELQGYDGVHPSPAGQSAIVTTLLRELTRLPRRQTSPSTSAYAPEADLKSNDATVPATGERP